VLQLSLYSGCPILFDTIQTVPHFTEARIHHLCTEALTLTEQADIERVMTELRSAIEEHVRLARESLTAQAATLSMLDSEQSV